MDLIRSPINMKSNSKSIRHKKNQKNDSRGLESELEPSGEVFELSRRTESNQGYLKYQPYQCRSEILVPGQIFPNSDETPYRRKEQDLEYMRLRCIFFKFE